ncbi:MAG: FecR domain-containing protein [Lentisphaeraceae bacterium]|nr:FecR domain-containing protein [Lentisphaeraceae bacterium]
MENTEKLIASYLSGTATEEETAQLLKLCKQKPDILEQLASHTKTDRLLSSLSTDLKLNTKEIIEQIENDAPDVSLTVIKSIKKKQQNKITTFIALAAAAIITFTLLIPSSKNIVTVTNNLEASWQYDINSPLKAGRYKLESGFTKLTFSSGADVLIEGPADFEIVNNMHLILTDGKVVADVSPSAHGFKIDTLNSNTIDLGTKFAVATDKSGATEIHVIQGLVKSKSKTNKEYVELKKDEALQVNKENLSEKLEADSGKFLTMLPPKKISDFKHILWRFDEGKGNTASEESSGYDEQFQAYLKSTDNNQPKWIDGKHGKALEFNGKSNFVETDFPGIGGSDSRTVCFWVKAGKEKNGYAIITWGSFEKYGATWQISLNPNKEDGPLGRIRCGTHRGQVIGTQDLRDSQWHHVAVVMYGGPEADVSTHILIFIDGKLENAYRKSIRQIDTDIESQNAIKVQMGKNAATNNNPNTIHKFFKGALDEVYVFNYALNPNEIRNIIKNRLIPSKSK